MNTSTLTFFENNRRQIEGVFSDLVNVTHGVPQGSILGRVFFSICTSFLHKLLKYCNMPIYADGIVVLGNVVLQIGR